MMENDRFLSGDWGTSSFRLKLVDTSSLQPLASTATPQGIKMTYEEWQRAGEPERNKFYRVILKKAIDQLSKEGHQDLQGYPLILSGMASSSIGMKELPYTLLPLPLDGSRLIVKNIPASDSFPHQTLLISGVAKPGDVMRGEEVQAIGCHQHSKLDHPEYTLILPGTHSKHLHIERGRIADFKTFMTGELYQVLRTCSILKNAIKPEKEWTANTQSAFAEGVDAIRRGNLSNLLFSIRAKVLEESLDKNEAGYYLSGLLIGNELKEMPRRPIVLGGNVTFYDMYTLALEVVELPEQVIAVDPVEVDRWVLYGHRAIWRKNVA